MWSTEDIIDQSGKTIIITGAKAASVSKLPKLYMKKVRL
jgi:hypothetical protein